MKYDLTWLKRQYDNGRKPEFLFFADTPLEAVEFPGSEVLTQWFPSAFVVDGDEYRHPAHWMMVQKARLFGDNDGAAELLSMDKDEDIVARGKQILGFEQEQWDERRYDIVLQGNFHKFSQHRSLKAYISGTHPRVLTEANPNDRIWGIGLRENAPGAMNPHQWRGLNLLGFALMEVRDLLSGFEEVAASFL